MFLPQKHEGAAPSHNNLGDDFDARKPMQTTEDGISSARGKRGLKAYRNLCRPVMPVRPAERTELCPQLASPGEGYLPSGHNRIADR